MTCFFLDIEKVFVGIGFKTGCEVASLSSGPITIPIVLENGHITKRKISYTFNGKYFVRSNKNPRHS